MTIEERKNAILAKIAEIKQGGSSAEVEDMRAALYEAIDDEHGGTIDDPIPFTQPMEIYNGKYYSQNGKGYLCTRDSGKPLAFNLADLVGLYVTEVTE